MEFLLDFFRGKLFDQLKRNDAFGAFAYRDSLYLWGGVQMGGRLRITYDQLERFFLDIQKFSLSSGKWVVETTTGMPPLGIAGYCCSVIGDQAYYFGGHNFLKQDDLHNSITQLSIDTLNWKVLQETDLDLPVMRKVCGGMVSFESNGEHHLLIIGGMGFAPTKPVPATEYWLCQKDDVRLDATTLYQTNEHSIYNISTGRWGNPAVIGECMPPARGFVIEEISNCRAIIFGGCTNKNGITDVRNDVYLLEIAVDNVQWQQLKQPGPSQQPSNRAFCGATIITSIGHPILVITGGLDENDQAINDSWFFSITDHTWTKVTDIPQSVCERDNHSLSAFTMAPYHVWLITVGGIRGKGSVENIADSTMLTELAFKDGQWLIGDSFNFNTEGKFQDKCYQQLRMTQKELLDVHQQLKKTEAANEQATLSKNKLDEEKKEEKKLRQELQEKVESLEQQLQQFIIPQSDLTKVTLEAHIDQLQKKLQEERQLTSRLIKQKGKEAKTDTVSEKYEEIESLKNILEEEKKEEKILRQELKEKVESLEQLLQQFIIPQSDLTDSSITVAGRGLFYLKAHDCPSSFNWDKYGFRLHCPEGAVSKDTAVAVTPLLSDQFEVPKGTILVSAVYKIKLSKPLSKRVVIELQHCVDLRNTGQTGCLKFVRASLKSPYQFSIIDGGVFHIGNRYGSIKRDDFCAMGIVAKMSNGGSFSGGGNGEEGNGGSEGGENSTGNGGGNEGGEDNVNGSSEAPTEESNNEEENTNGDTNGDTSGDTSSNEDTNGATGGDSSGNAVEGISPPSNDNTSPQVSVKLDTIQKMMPDTTIPGEQLEAKLEVTAPSSGNETDHSTTHSRNEVSPSDILYTGRMYHVEKKVVGHWKTIYSVVKDLEVLKQYFDAQHPNAEPGDVVTFFKFVQPNGVLQLHLQTPQQLGWIVNPDDEPMELYQSTVAKFPSNPLYTSCSMAVYAKPGIVQDPLHCPIKLTGIIPSKTVFINRPLPPPPPSSNSPGASQTSRKAKESTFKSAVAYKVMTECTGMIKERVGLYPLIDKLVEKRMISEAERNQITDQSCNLTTDQRMDKLLGFIKASIKEDGEDFGLFIEIIKQENTRRADRLAQTLLDTYKDYVLTP